MFIAVDAMGGDHAPGAVVEGALQAAEERQVPVILVGDADSIRRELERLGKQESASLVIRHATERVEMGESPISAIRGKPDSSMRVALQLVKSGEADAVVSAGNSGAMLALAVTILGTLKGVDRPAIVTAIPAVGGYTCLLDAGANTECKPLHFVQFAIMGEVYARLVRGIASPRVGVLSNGEEDSKGTDLTRLAHVMLKKAHLNYIGYVEGRDLNNGKVDVIVTDGFTGNVALKTLEGFAHFFQGQLRTLFTANWKSKLSYLLIRNALTDLRASFDPSEIGGAPLLGTDGLAIIAHGASSPKAIKNAIRVAEEASRQDINRKIVESLQALPEAALTTPESKSGRQLWASIRERFLHVREPHNPPAAPEPTAKEEKKKE
ncbi:MAG: phosphate acyltransferase PlsX [Deltaproteobacteria bacterium]|nr:phosphate acyltransferase PlsX [Deltaproteobacteria bacterium]